MGGTEHQLGLVGLRQADCAMDDVVVTWASVDDSQQFSETFHEVLPSREFHSMMHKYERQIFQILARWCWLLDRCGSGVFSGRSDDPGNFHSARGRLFVRPRWETGLASIPIPTVEGWMGTTGADGDDR